MQSKFSNITDPLEKSRQLYKEAQSDIENNRLNRITQDRMKKRYQYVAREIYKKQQIDSSQGVQQMIFYRNKFHSLVTLVGQSMRESYNRNKFQTEVRNILKDDWERVKGSQNYTLAPQNINSNDKFQNQKANKSRIATSYINQLNQLNKVPDTLGASNQYRPTKSELVSPPSPLKIVKEEPQFVEEVQKTQHRSRSPLQDFFDSKLNKSQKKVGFDSIIPKSQQKNSVLLSGLKQMNKKVGNSTIKDKQQKYLMREDDSKIRDLKRQNQELQKIIRRRQFEGEQSPPKQTVSELQKEVYYYQKVNRDLRQQTVYPNNSNSYSIIGSNSVRYNIHNRPNDFNELEFRKLRYNTFQRVEDDRSKSKSKSNIGSKVQKQSSKSRTSSIVQRQKEMYINRTPQILFENQLIKVMVIRYPLKIQQRYYEQNSKLNPEESSPNEQRLQLLVLNNSKNKAKNQQMEIRVSYEYDKKCHRLEQFKIPNRGYSHKAQSAEDIVYSEIVKVKLIDVQGYNQEIKSRVQVNYINAYENSINAKAVTKHKEHFQVAIKLPVTFIEFSRKPFGGVQSNSNKKRLTIKPNPLYSTYQHAYMNTNLPMMKSNSSKGAREQAIMYGRSFIHDSKRGGKYLQSQINLAWIQKGHNHYISISAIQEWVYLVSYLFLDVQDEEQEFEREFRKPSLHVNFNTDNRQFI